MKRRPSPGSACRPLLRINLHQSVDHLPALRTVFDAHDHWPGVVVCGDSVIAAANGLLVGTGVAGDSECFS